MTKHPTHQKLEVAASLREVTGSKVTKLRMTGLLPAVLYGKGQESLNIQLDAKAFEKIFHQAGESTLVYLKLEGKEYPSLVHEVARDPQMGTLMHADFYKVRLDEKIKTMVPVVFVGEAPAVADLTGVFARNVNELEVEALPSELPHEIEVDISKLTAVGSQLTVADIKGHGWVLTASPEEIVASITAAKTEEQLAAELAAPTTDISAVEEIKKETEAEVPAEEGEVAPTVEANTVPKEPAAKE